MATAAPKSSIPEGVTRSVYKNGRFWNPWDTLSEPPSGISSIFKFMFSEKNNSNIPSQRVSMTMSTK